jgi:hypothetical protein
MRMRRTVPPAISAEKPQRHLALRNVSALPPGRLVLPTAVGWYSLEGVARHLHPQKGGCVMSNQLEIRNAKRILRNAKEAEKHLFYVINCMQTVSAVYDADWDDIENVLVQANARLVLAQHHVKALRQELTDRKAAPNEA